MLSPLKEETEGLIPGKTLLEWKHRSNWTGNRCLRVVYRALRTWHVSVWFYFIPFVALAANFAVPFLAEKYGDANKVTLEENMNEDYVNWLEATLL